MFDYSGDDICFEEMPQGCVIISKGGEVIVSSFKDAIALRDSLNRLIKTMVDNDLTIFPEEEVLKIYEERGWEQHKASLETYE